MRSAKYIICGYPNISWQESLWKNNQIDTRNMKLLIYRKDFDSAYFLFFVTKYKIIIVNPPNSTTVRLNNEYMDLFW